MGKFHRILNPGLNILTPIIDRIKYVQCLKEIAIEIPQQTAVTSGTFNYMFKYYRYKMVLIILFFYCR